MKSTAIILLLFLTGCTTVYMSDKMTVISNRGFGLRIVTSASSSSGMPEIDLGAFSSIVQIIPTSTNGPIFAPNYFNTAGASSKYNPFDVGLSESTGVGNVAVHLGDDATADSSVIVPKFKPSVPTNEVQEFWIPIARATNVTDRMWRTNGITNFDQLIINPSVITNIDLKRN